MRKNKKGFTLVEIIVVLVIIGILLAIAVPSVLGYVHKAQESRLLQEARNVLIVAKEYGIKLKAKEQLDMLNSNTVKQDILDDADVDGEWMELQVNASYTNIGNFVVKIENKYITYDDERQVFTLSDTYEKLTAKTDQIMSELLKKDSPAFGKIKEYFKNRTGSLDSEGGNYGQPIKEFLKEAGLAEDSYSFRIFKDTNRVKITISTRKIKSEDAGHESVEVIQYDFGNRQDFSGTPVVRQGKVPVIIKSVSGSPDFPILDVENGTDWETI